MKYSKRSLPYIAICIASLAVLTESSEAQLTFFDVPNQEIDLSGMPIGSVANNSANVTLGGVSTIRNLTGVVTATLNPISIQGYLYDGAFGLSQGGGDGSNLVVEWGSAGDMGLNLEAYGNEFTFTHSSNDGVTGSQVQITVWNGSTSFTAPSTTLTHGSFGGSTGYDYLVPFSMFSGADFSNIDRISFSLQATAAADVEINNFQVIPEPSSMILSGVGVAALLRRRRN